MESSESLLRGMFFDPKRYDLAKVGRYKFNKNLSLKSRVSGTVLDQDVIDPLTGEIVCEAETVLTPAILEEIQDTGVASITVRTDEGKAIKVLSNRAVSMDPYIAQYGITSSDIGVKEKVYYPVMREILDAFESVDALKATVKERYHELVPIHITVEDIMASINYVMHLDLGYGNVDDIDHLGNRRIRSVGELLQNQFRIGLSRMERVVRERMTIQDMENATPQALINVRPVTAAIKEFFGSSQLSQFMDQNNPLPSLRISAVFQPSALEAFQEKEPDLRFETFTIRITEECAP